MAQSSTIPGLNVVDAAIHAMGVNKAVATILHTFRVAAPRVVVPAKKMGVF